MGGVRFLRPLYFHPALTTRIPRQIFKNRTTISALMIFTILNLLKIFSFYFRNIHYFTTLVSNLTTTFTLSMGHSILEAQMPKLIIHSEISGIAVDKSHFGANYLANREARHNQGIEGDNVFGHAADMVGVNSFRYPGGTITEMFMDLSDPRHFSAKDGELLDVVDRFTHRGQDALTPVGQFLKFVSARGGESTIVLPTITYFEDLSSGDSKKVAAVEAEIKQFVKNAVSAPGGHTISGFEIGNEYPGWNNGYFDLIPEGSRDYAMLARNLSVWVNEALEDVEPDRDIDIIIQSSFFAQGPNGNNQLIDAFFDLDLQETYNYVESVEKAVEAITATSIHSYPYTPWELGAYKGAESIFDDLKLIDDWKDALREFGVTSGSQVEEISSYVTEWNTRSAAIRNGTISGAQEATALLFQFDTLLRAGIEEMYVWPVLQNNNSDLLNGTDVDELEFDFNGLIFSRLSRMLVGMNVLNIERHHDVDGDSESDFLTFAYEGEEGLVFYVASISNKRIEHDIDISSLSSTTSEYQSLLGGVIGSTTISALDEIAQPEFRPLPTSILEGAVDRDGVVSVDLQPWELMEFHFEMGSPSEVVADHELDIDNQLEGSDLDNTLHGSGGDDTIRGNGGSDIVHGGAGDDLISGRSGHDTIFGGTGDDTVFGDNGRDLSYLGDGNDLYIDNEQGGKYGNDTIWGGDGNDTIDSGAGSNELHGEAGNDLIGISGGVDLATGGLGNDIFNLIGNTYHSSSSSAINVSSDFQTGTNRVISLEGKVKFTGGSNRVAFKSYRMTCG